MERFTEDTCSYKGHTYGHDSEVCGDGKCMICKDGNWEETTDLFPPKETGI